MSINERVKILRKNLKLTQSEFGERIGLKNVSISRIESGDMDVTERSVKTICSTFGVNYRWLTTGQGDVFSDYDGAILDELTQKYQLDNLDRQIVSIYLKMSPAEREGMKLMIHKLMGK